jgi:GTP-binding protein
MKRKPIVAVVGRPNVGKSTFVNRLVGKRQSIVDDLPGVTRDRIYFDVEWQNKVFTVIDTGGIVPGDEDEIMVSIYDQAKIACEEADKIIFIVDGIEGATPVDFDIANILRQSGKQVFLAVNKVDSSNQITMISDFYSLAIGEPRAISALHGSGGVGDLLEEITADFDLTAGSDYVKQVTKLLKKTYVCNGSNETLYNHYYDAVYNTLVGTTSSAGTYFLALEYQWLSQYYADEKIEIISKVEYHELLESIS